MLIQKGNSGKMAPPSSEIQRLLSSKGRVPIVLACVVAAFILLIGYGIYFQLFQQEKYLNEGNNRFVRTISLPASRGTITDRNGTILALSAPAESLYAIPSAMETELPFDKLQALSDLIDVPMETLNTRFAQKNRSFVYLKRQLPADVVEQITALQIKGLAFRPESIRYYPMNDLFSHVIGFTNIDGKGLEGLELARESSLHGKDGAKVVLRDSKGNIVDKLDSPRNSLPQDGAPLVLSLDQRIQVLAATELKKAIQHHQAKAGSVVVLDAHTGEVLALVNSPSYDPNHPSDTEIGNRRNRAITDMIEPGSAMKPFPVAKALDDGKIRVNSVFNTNAYAIGPAMVRDTHTYPALDTRGILQKSSNVGTSRISARYSPKEMYDFYHSLGIGQRMHTGFPGETAGLLRNWKNWKPIEQATMSFGYGLQLSLLQLARAYTILTTDGNLMPISFEKQVEMPKGESVIKPTTAKAMRQMMIAVTEPGGTGTAGAVDGFNVAAKTGTARKLVNGRYVDNKHMATFIGFAPAEKPRLIVAVNVDEPSVNGYYGGTVAGPVFKAVMTGGLNILGVSPTKPLKEKTVVQAAQNKPSSN